MCKHAGTASAARRKSEIGRIHSIRIASLIAYLAGARKRRGGVNEAHYPEAVLALA